MFYCPHHPAEVISNGTFDAPCGACEQAMEGDDPSYFVWGTGLTAAQKACLDHSREVRAEVWERIGDHMPPPASEQRSRESLYPSAGFNLPTDEGEDICDNEIVSLTPF